MKRIGKYKIDFVIPLKRQHLFFPTVIEAVIEFYTPRTIYIITSITEIEKLTEEVSIWNIKKTKIHFIHEETFFQHHYDKSLEKIKKCGDWKFLGGTSIRDNARIVVMY